MLKLKLFIGASLLLNFFFILAAVVFINYQGGLLYIYDRAINILDDDQEIDLKQTIFESSEIEDVDIMFVGDSITGNGVFNEYFPDKIVINRGKSGDESTDILARIDEIIKRNPKELYLMIGTNDIWQECNIDSYERNVREILERILSESPETSITIQSIIPVNNKEYNVSFKNEDIDKFNNVLENISEDKELEYIDLHPALEDDEGKLIEEYTNDGIHLIGAGYNAWMELIE